MVRCEWPELSLIPLPSGLNETLSIKFESQNGHELFFKLKSTTVLQRLCDAWCLRLYGSRMGVNGYSMNLIFDGTRIDQRLTAECYGLEDGDIIDVVMVQQGD